MFKWDFHPQGLFLRMSWTWLPIKMARSTRWPDRIINVRRISSQRSYTSIQSPAGTSRMALAKRSLHDYCARCRAGSAEASLAAYNIVTWNTHLGLELYSNYWRLHCISCGLSSPQESMISSKKLARNFGGKSGASKSPHDSTLMPRFAIYHNTKLQCQPFP